MGGYFLVGPEQGTLLRNSHMFRAWGTYRDTGMWVQFLLWLSLVYKFELTASHTNALTSRYVAVSLGALDRWGKLDFNGLLLGCLVGTGQTWPTSCRSVCCHTRHVRARLCCRGDDPLELMIRTCSRSPWHARWPILGADLGIYWVERGRGDTLCWIGFIKKFALPLGKLCIEPFFLACTFSCFFRFPSVIFYSPWLQSSPPCFFPLWP